MSENPKVSIVIPVYNGKDYIEEAIDSALSQTYENIEIVIINDGSNDNGTTRKIIERYGNKVKYFEKENGGVSTALNLALKKMTGDYFSWLSHDDRYYPNKIEEQIKFLRDYDERTILYSDYDLMDSNSQVFTVAKKNNKELNIKPEYCLLRGAINGITLLIPKKAFDEYGEFDESLKCTQDYEMWFRMLKTYKFVHQPLVLSTTRLHQEQTTNTNPRVVEEGNILWNNMIKAISKNDKIRLEGSEYAFYKEMLKFIETTPYLGTKEFLTQKIISLEKASENKSKSTKVSVIIPFYKRLDEVEKAIISALNQTHKKIEIVLVNDGTKNIDVLKPYIENKNVKFINIKDNSGVSHARNLGIENSTGDYIAFLDSDDIFLENKLQKQLEITILNNSDFSYTSYYRKSKNNNELINCKNLENNLIANCNIATPTVMLKKDLIDKYNLRYDINKRYAEDNCFYFDILKHTNPLYINEPLTVVNVNENSGFINKDKQIEGMKTILNYVLNDDLYKNYNKEISILCQSLYKLINENTNSTDINISNVNNNFSLTGEKRIKKYYIVFKEKGFVYCFKRVLKKLTSR